MNCSKKIGLGSILVREGPGITIFFWSRLKDKNVVQLTVAVVAEDMAEAELDSLSGAVVGLTCS